MESMNEYWKNQANPVMYYYGTFATMELAEAFATECRKAGMTVDVYADREVYTSKEPDPS